MPLIQIFIATYNRPKLVTKAVSSALNQNYDSYEVIVSDNSTNNETEILLAKIKNERLFYKKREPSLHPIDHLNAILADVKSEYFMIFHDDDIMHPDMIRTLMKKINGRKDVMAIGANAKVVKNGRIKWNNFNKKLKSDTIISDRSSMAELYLTDHIVPFPSYLYRREISSKLKLDTNHGGKYCDAAFIIDITSLGNVMLCASPLMDSCKHPDQDSSINSFNDRIRLINYIVRTTEITRRNTALKKFRVNNIYAEYKRKILNKEIVLFSKDWFRMINFFKKMKSSTFFLKIITISLLDLFHVKFIKR